MNTNKIWMWQEYDGHVWVGPCFNTAYSSKNRAKSHIIKIVKSDDRNKIMGFFHENEEGTCVIYYYCIIDHSHDDYIDDVFKQAIERRKLNHQLTLADVREFEGEVFKLTDFELL